MTESQHQAILEALRKGDAARAESLCEAFLRSGGGAEGLYLMGVIRSIRGDRAAARRMMGRAAALLPERADIAYNHGVVLREADKLAEAVAEWRRAVTLDPDHRDAQANLALALDHFGDRPGAIDAYRRLLERWPDDRDGLYNAGNFAQRRGDAASARDAYQRLVEKHPGFAPGWINFGMLAKRMRDYDESESCYRRAITADPGFAGAHFNLANLLLTRGRWREGFAEYEWRLQLPGEARPEWKLPEWTGNEPSGTRVLLWGDQGYGDAIQFLRFAPLAAAKGHRVFVVVKAELRTLAATAPGVEAAYQPADTMPEADAQLSLASLPQRLGIDDPARLWTGAYLRVPAPVPIPNARPPLAGLVWAGDPRHPNDANRSARLIELAPLFAVPDLTWVSLQLGPAHAQLAVSPWADKIVDLAPSLADFAATAGFVQGLDLVVTVDTATAHLVGAMGRKGMVLLPWVDCDWRWLDAGDATPWYPSLRLFRQASPGDWSGVAKAVAAALASRGK